MEDELNNENFNKEFWKWFDALPKIEKNRFWHYAADMAKLYFYNKYYVKKKQVGRQGVDKLS